MPRYRENPLIVKFTLLCPGISQNSKHHQLTLYKGQVWREKSYLELCDENVLNVLYNSKSGTEDNMQKNGELYVPPVPGRGFIIDSSQIPWDSEILQSFAELTHITTISFHPFDPTEDSVEDFTYQILVGRFKCKISEQVSEHYEKCVPHHSYEPYYIWTKEGLKIQINKFVWN